MKVIIISLLSVFIFSHSFSQEDIGQGYKRGYVVTNAGDTLHGYVQRGNAVKLRFKKDAKSKHQKFKANELFGFVRGASQYHSIDASPNLAASGYNPNFGNGYQNSGTFHLGDVVFGKILKKGAVNLYVHYDAQEKYWSGGQTNGLKSDLYLSKDNGRTTVRIKLVNFKKNMLEFFQDDKYVSDMIKSGKLNYHNYDDLVRIYNERHR